jgi:hypothetical protein
MRRSKRKARCSSHRAETSSGNKKRCGGVQRRASTVHREYERKCDKADAEYNGVDTSGGMKGPMRRSLAEFGQVRSLVIGPRGEGSEDLHRLLVTTADVATERKWRRMGTRNPHEARAVIKGRMYRSIGILACARRRRCSASAWASPSGTGELRASAASGQDSSPVPCARSTTLTSRVVLEGVTRRDLRGPGKGGCGIKTGIGQGG